MERGFTMPGWAGCDAGRVIVAGAIAVIAVAGSAQGQGFFPRGDADCSLRFGAADSVAMVRGIGGNSPCDNDDCDRNGVLDAGDLACTIACMFDDCPTPPTAPEVAAIELETGEALTPFATIHVIGNNVGSAERLKRVTFNGVDAEVIEFIPPDELVVLVPPLAPGFVEMAIHDGDLVGTRTSVEIAAQIPVGQPDDLDGTFELVDTVAARFAALPLETHYGDDALLVGSAIEELREELEQQLGALVSDPGFTPQVRAQLDAALDSSGVPEDLRELLADIEEIESEVSVIDGGRAAQATSIANIGRRLGRVIVGAAGVVVAATGVVAAAAASGLSAPAAAVAVAAGAAVNVLTLAGSAALPPIIFDITFTTASAIRVGGPTPGGFVVVRGRRLLGTNFVLQVAGGSFSIPPQIDNEDTRQFRLPGDMVGFCGRASYYLERSFPLAGSTVPIPDGVIPMLESFIGPNPVVPGDEVSMRVHGVTGCTGYASFGSGDAERTQVRMDGLSPTVAEAHVPNAEPGPYNVYLLVDRRRSETLAGLTLETGVRTVEVTCALVSSPGVTDLVMSPASPASVLCDASTLPRQAFRPRNSYFAWTSSDSETAQVMATAVNERGIVTAKQPGTAQIRATLKVENQSFANTTTAWRVNVRDASGPTVSLSATATSVTAGSPISVRVRATDNVSVTRVSITATGDPAVNGQQELPCPLEKTCSQSFTVNTASTVDPERNQVTIVARAFDSAGNMVSSAPVTVTVTPAVDETCPTLSISSPPNGGTVNAGATVQVVAHATDDFGVKTFRYSASGDALVAGVGRDLSFPNPLMSADLRFTFMVKTAADLMNVSNRAITITVEAFDEKGNTCGAQTTHLSILGVLDNCQGSIVTDNTADFIGEPFTITVTITGPTAAEITRVTSINPGGQFDLTSRGNGVYNVTLFYQGTGRFVLSFTAFDAQGNSRCSGSIGLESLGPEP